MPYGNPMAQQALMAQMFKGPNGQNFQTPDGIGGVTQTPTTVGPSFDGPDPFAQAGIQPAQMPGGGAVPLPPYTGGGSAEPIPPYMGGAQAQPLGGVPMPASGPGQSQPLPADLQGMGPMAGAGMGAGAAAAAGDPDKRKRLIMALLQAAQNRGG